MTKSNRAEQPADGAPNLPRAYDGLKATALLEALARDLHDPEVSLAPLLPVIERALRTARGAWGLAELLSEHPADLRVAHLALSVLRDFHQLPHRSETLWRRLVAAVEHHGDSSCSAPLVALKAPKPTAQPRLRNLAQRLAKRAPVAPKQPRTASRPAGKNGAALLAEVFANPAADAPREVYADHLLDLGDPRGEFIQLQFMRSRGTATAASRAREAELLKQHAETWLGALAPVAKESFKGREVLALASELEVPGPKWKGVTFARGFVRRLPYVAILKHREGVLDDPAFATVEHVTFVPKVTPAMRSLVSMGYSYTDRRLLEGLLSHTWDTLGVDLSAQGRDADHAAIGRLFHGCRVRRLELDLDHTSAAPALEIIRAATTENPRLRELVLWGPYAWRDWSWRALPLSQVEKVVVDLESRSRFEISPSQNHLDFYGRRGWLINSLDVEALQARPFATARVFCEAADERELKRELRSLGIARKILT